MRRQLRQRVSSPWAKLPSTERCQLWDAPDVTASGNVDFRQGVGFCVPSLLRLLSDTVSVTRRARYADAAADGGLEPVEKDALLDVLARHFTGRPWPPSCDMASTRRFMADLQNAMIATRWRVDPLAIA
jgi:hypothetical protein